MMLGQLSRYGRRASPELGQPKAAVATWSLVTLEQMVTALLVAVENPSAKVEVVGVAEICSGNYVKSLASGWFLMIAGRK